MAQFLVLLHDDPKVFADLSPDEAQRIIEKYVAWGNNLRADGHYLGSNKLTDDGGRVVRRANGRLRVTDGPFSEGKEVLAGYYVVEARDYDEAVERISACPHFEYGTVELRQIHVF